MTTKELTAKVAGKTGVNADYVKCVIDEAFDQIRKSVESGEPYFKRGFGTIGVKMRKGGVCNLNGKAWKMQDRIKPFFKPCKDFVTKCNG